MQGSLAGQQERLWGSQVSGSLGPERRSEAGQGHEDAEVRLRVGVGQQMHVRERAG